MKFDVVVVFLLSCIPVNHPDFIGMVPILDFQNLKKSGCPDFPEFQPVYIPLFKVMFKT